MELKHGYVLVAGIVFSVIVVLLHIFLKKRNKPYKDGTKIYNMAFVRDNSYLKRRKKLYKLLSVFVVLALFAGVIATSVLVARPYKSKVKKANIHSRDIILCMDVGSQHIQPFFCNALGSTGEYFSLGLSKISITSDFSSFVSSIMYPSGNLSGLFLTASFTRMVSTMSYRNCWKYDSGIR